MQNPFFFQLMMRFGVEMFEVIASFAWGDRLGSGRHLERQCQAGRVSSAAAAVMLSGTARVAAPMRLKSKNMRSSSGSDDGPHRHRSVASGSLGEAVLWMFHPRKVQKTCFLHVLRCFHRLRIVVYLVDYECPPDR